MKLLTRLLCLCLLPVACLLPAAIATTYIWGVGPKIVVIDDGYDVIVNGPPPRGTPRPGTPRPTTPAPKPATPKPGATPKPASLTSEQQATLAGNAVYAAWARQDPVAAMTAAMGQPNKSHVLRVAQIWDGLDRAAFEAWYLTITDTELRKCIALAIPGSRQIDPDKMRAHPDFEQMAQSWAVFESEHNPTRVRAFAATVAEPLRGLLLEIAQ